MRPSCCRDRVYRAGASLFIAATMLAACSSGGGGGGGKKKDAGGGGGGGGDEPAFIDLTTFMNASVVIGQPDFAANEDNQGGEPSSTSLSDVYDDVWVEGDVLYVPDYSNHRILGYDQVPSENGAAADFVIGQPNFTSTTDNSSAGLVIGPAGLQVDDDKLFIADWDNHRVVIYDPAPTGNGAAADLAVGQINLTATGFDCLADTMYNPESLFVVDGKLIVTDSSNSRVLIWNSIPTEDGTAADIVLGQNSLTDCTSGGGVGGGGGLLEPVPGPSARTLNYPTDVWSDGTVLLVVDQNYHRVLIWNAFPTENFAPADLVLGQPDMSTVDAGASDSGLNFPWSVTSNGTQVLVADYENHRVLIWDSFPAENGQAADKVLGQSDFDHVTASDDDQNDEQDDTASARTFNYPTGLRIVGNRLFVADESNYRFLIFEGRESP